MFKSSNVSQEMDYKRYFCDKYFANLDYHFDINFIDVVVNKYNNPFLYIEFKNIIFNDNDRKRALAQIILTNKIQKHILNKVAIAYKDENNDDILIYIDCSDNSIMYHNDINWNKEKRSNPSVDAVYHIYNRISDKLQTYKNDEIALFIYNLINDKDIGIDITIKNFNVIFNEWKNEIKFEETIANEQELISLFFVDILNNTKYENKVKTDLFINPINFDGTDLNNYEITTIKEKISFLYSGKKSQFWSIKNQEKYHSFWLKYNRPPEESEFLKILERSATLYTDKYRRTTGAEYTPSCFVKLQNDILFNKKDKLALNIDDFIIFDPCCGVANLENDFGRDYKDNCFLSTLETNDVDICRIKGFENIIQYDFLNNENEFPKFQYQGNLLSIEDIAKKANKKLMIIMNPPYQIKKGSKNNLAIEFFNKCLKLKPDYIVFYYKFEAFFNTEIQHFIKSKYSIISHIISNAKTTFLLNEWGVSQIVFSKSKQNSIYNFDKNNDFLVDRYELNIKKNQLEFIQSYKYCISQKNLIKELDKKIKNSIIDVNLFNDNLNNSDNLNKEQIQENNLLKESLINSTIIGQYSYMSQVLVVGNGKISKNMQNKITINNLKYCLISKGINFNTHAKYFETNFQCFKGEYENISNELKADAIIFSLFYKNNMFSNKENINYIMPFSASELENGCIKNNLNVLNYFQIDISKNNSIQKKTFDFREWLSQFNFSQEALDLKNAALKIFQYYHRNNNYENKNFNDSFYDITNAIMGKQPAQFQELETDNDMRINKTKTTKGTKGFGRNTIKSVINNEQDLKIFYNFFDKRDVLAKKINKQLVEQGLLLWARENIY